MEKLILKSALYKFPVEIIYQAKDGTFSKRKIMVTKVSKHSILAYCYLKKQYRTFMLDKIFAVQLDKHNYHHIG